MSTHTQELHILYSFGSSSGLVVPPRLGLAVAVGHTQMRCRAGDMNTNTNQLSPLSSGPLSARGARRQAPGAALLLLFFILLPKS